MRRKLLILGIDCLDPYLVAKWRIESFVLAKHGIHFVGYDLYTPVIWAKFLTGMNVEEWGFNSRSLMLKKRLATLYGLLNVATNIVKRGSDSHSDGEAKDLATFRGLGKVVKHCENSIVKTVRRTAIKYVSNNFDLSKLSLIELTLTKLVMRASLMEKLPKKLYRYTFLYSAKRYGLKPLVIHFPPVNDYVYSILRNMLYFFIDLPPQARTLFLESIWKLTCESIEMLIDAIKASDHELILWYTPYIDIASHMFYRRNITYLVKLRIAYGKLASLIKSVIDMALSQNYDVLIVSDHGFDEKRMDHSHFGYWSSSWNPPYIPSKVTDFANIVKMHLGIR